MGGLESCLVPSSFHTESRHSRQDSLFRAKWGLQLGLQDDSPPPPTFSTFSPLLRFLASLGPYPFPCAYWLRATERRFKWRLGSVSLSLGSLGVRKEEKAEGRTRTGGRTRTWSSFISLEYEINLHYRPSVCLSEFAWPFFHSLYALRPHARTSRAHLDRLTG